MLKPTLFTKLGLPDLANKRKSRVVAEVIIEAIRDGRLHPSDKLPAERVMAEQLGVSRGAVREALSALQLASVIRIRTGEGSYISQSPLSEDGAAQVFSLLEENESPLELWEARCQIEITLVRLSSGSASLSQIGNVKECLDVMREHAATGDVESYLEANNTFHESLILPVENSILRRFASQLIQATNQLLTIDSVNKYLHQSLDQSLAKHVAIFKAYIARDPDAIRASINHHFDELIAHYLNS